MIAIIAWAALGLGACTTPATRPDAKPTGTSAASPGADVDGIREEPLRAGGMNLDRLIGWLSGSRLNYRLTEGRVQADAFASFMREGFPDTVVSVERRHVLSRLEEARAARNPRAARDALLDAVLVDARGGDAWEQYLFELAREGRSIPPAPLAPPGTVRLEDGGAEIIYPAFESAWAFYLSCKAAARIDPGFRAQMLDPYDETEAYGNEYAWTLREEVGCLRVLTEAVRRAAQEGQVPRRLAAHILAAEEADVLEGYAVVEALGSYAPGRLAAASAVEHTAGQSYLRWAARPVAVLPPPGAVPPRPSTRISIDALTSAESLRLEAAQAALAMGAAREALHTLEDVAMSHPHNTDVLLALAEARWRTGDLRGAVSAAELADTETPGRPHTWHFLARARLAVGDGAGAQEAADRLRWLWWLGRDPGLNRAPVLFWGEAHGGAVIERLDASLGDAARFWWIDPARNPRTSRPLVAEDPVSALREAHALAD